MEDRSHMWRGSYLRPGQALHLGIDYTVPEGSAVHLPCNCSLHSAIHDPDQNFGWGGKAIFLVRPETFVIFGHIDLIGLHRPGEQYHAGDLIGRVAPPARNGGWDPHLHLQMVGPGLNPDILDGYTAPYEHVRLDFPDPMVLDIIP